MSVRESYSQNSDQCAHQPSDEELVSLVRQGRITAFETLVKRYEMPLFNYIRRMVGSATDAEDLFQETFLRVHTHLGSFRATARFRPWVYRIATNLCRDHLRYRRRHAHVSLDDAAHAEPDSENLVNTIASPIPTPRELASEKEVALLLETAVGKLSAKHRSVFLMARYQGMPYDEIAHTLGIPLGTVKSRMNKAVQFLLNELKEVTQ